MKLGNMFLIFLSLMVLNVQAHGPTPKKADESIVINAPIDTVWVVIKNFDKISDWHPDVKSSTGDGKNKSGGERSLSLDAGMLEESLDYFSDTDHEYSYRLKKENTAVFPVSSYTTAIKLIAEGNQTQIQWKSRFYRGDTSNTPPERLNDEAAVKAMKEFIQNGLQGLKEKLEK